MENKIFQCYCIFSTSDIVLQPDYCQHLVISVYVWFCGQFMCVKVHVEVLLLRTCVSVMCFEARSLVGILGLPFELLHLGLTPGGCCSLLNTSTRTIDNGHLPQCMISLPGCWGSYSGPQPYVANTRLTGSLPSSGLPFYSMIFQCILKDVNYLIIYFSIHSFLYNVVICRAN